MLKGVYKNNNKYSSAIKYKKTIFSLGTFENEELAHNQYLKAKNIIKSGIKVEEKLKSISKKQRKESSFCYYDKEKKKYRVSIFIGYFDDLESAIIAKNKTLELLKK